jgi:predicted dehydrogenase
MEGIHPLFKICVIGCGWVANFGHGPSYQKYAANNPDVELTACCDVDEKKSVHFKEMYGFKKHYTDFRKMLKEDKPDAVCLNVPAALNASFSDEILKAGYPLLLEKPIGANLDEAVTLNKNAGKYGTPNMVAFNRRFMPLIQTFKKTILNTISLNEIQSIEYYLSRFNRTEDNFDITAIHGIDTVRYISDSDYKSLHYKYRKFPQYGKNVMNIHCIGELVSGATAVLNFYPVSGAVVERMVVNTFDYSFFINIPVWDSIDIPGKIVCIEKNEIMNEIMLHDNRQDVAGFERYGFYGEDVAFFDAVRHGKKLAPDIQESLQTVEIMECIRTKQKQYYL